MGTHPEQMFGFVIHEVARLLRRRFEQRLRSTGTGLTRAQAAALIHLAARGSCNQACLAQSMDIEPITLVRILDRLEELELIVRKADPRDRRAHVLGLTAKAEAMLEQIYGLANEVYGEAHAGLSAADVDRMLNQLNAMKANLLESTAESAAAPAKENRSTRRV
jgi:MarR family transcriptional regulator for hemolysin